MRPCARSPRASRKLLQKLLLRLRSRCAREQESTTSIALTGLEALESVLSKQGLQDMC